MVFLRCLLHVSSNGPAGPSGMWACRDSRGSVQVRAYAEHTGGHQLKIPINETHVRSLNLAVSAGVGMYEAIRQLSQQP